MFSKTLALFVQRLIIIDVSLMRKKVGLVTSASWTIPDWLFAIETQTTPAILKSDMTVIINGANQTINIKALCSGDVLGDYVPAP